MCHKTILKLFFLLVVQHCFIVICTEDIMILDLCSLSVKHKSLLVILLHFMHRLSSILCG